MNAKALVLVAVCLLSSAPAERVCRHGRQGSAVPVSLDRAERAREDLARALSRAWNLEGRLSAGLPWDSGLPACARREVRRVSARTPASLVGKTLGFGPESRMPAADIKVATRVTALASADSDALADPAFAARFGVRCWPARVRVVSEVELELLENP